MDWVIIAIALIVTLGLPLLVLFIYEGIFKWNSRFGTEIYYSDLLGFRIREKGVDCNFDLKAIDQEVLTKITQHAEYKDKEIFKHLHCVMTKDLYGGYNNSIKAIGTATMATFFWWKKLSRERIISMDVETIEERELNNKTIAGLFIHEYLHHWLDKHKGDSDGDHGEIIWKIFRV